MSIEGLTDATQSVARPKPTEAPSETNATKKALEHDESTQASRVSLDASKEMDDLVKLISKAPTGVSESRLEDIESQVKNGQYLPNLDTAAAEILDELNMLPDPPFDTLPLDD